MACWRLRASHYLNIPGTTYQYRETAQDTGETITRTVPVPRLLSIDDPKCFNDGEGGIIVTTSEDEKRKHPRYWLFVGEPTPDMDPLDDEAEEISTALSPKWISPLDSLPATGGVDFADSIAKALAKVLDDASRNKSTSIGSAGPDVIAEMQKQMQMLMDQNIALAAKVAAMGGAKTSTEAAARRA